jgi:hypothetical protein
MYSNNGGTDNELSHSAENFQEVLFRETHEARRGGAAPDEELSIDSEDDFHQNSNVNGYDDDDDWIYETGSSTEELDTDWDTKCQADITVGLDTIIDNVDQSLDKEKLIAMSERYTNPTIVAMFLLYTKHLINVEAYSNLVTIVQQPWFEPGVLPRSLKGISLDFNCSDLGLRSIRRFLPLANLQATKVARKVDQLDHKASKVAPSYTFDVTQTIARMLDNPTIAPHIHQGPAQLVINRQEVYEGEAWRESIVLSGRRIPFNLHNTAIYPSVCVETYEWIQQKAPSHT